MTHTRRITVLVVGVLTFAGVFAGAPSAEAQDAAWVHELHASLQAQARAIAASLRQLSRNDEDREWLRDAMRNTMRDVQLQVRGGRRADRRGGEEATEPFNRTARLGRPGTLDLENIAGNIVITGGGGDTVRIDAVKRVRGRDAAEARARLADLVIEVTERADRVEVRTEYPARRDFYGEVEFTVAVPSRAAVTVRTVSGDVRVTNVDGELRMQSVSGELVASDVKGLTRIRSVSGNVQVTKAEGADVTGGSLSGDVVLNGLKSKGIELQTVSGDLRLTDLEVDRATLRSVSGDIEYRGRFARNGRYELQSHSGDLRVVPRDAGFELDAGTFSGDVRSDFELKLQGTANQPAPQTGPQRGRAGRQLRGRGIGQRIRGQSDGGGAMLSLQSFSGDIVVARP